MNDSKLVDIDYTGVELRMLASTKSSEGCHIFEMEKSEEPLPIIPKRAIATYRRGGKNAQLAALLAVGLGSSGAAAFNQLFGYGDTADPKNAEEKTLEDVVRLAKAEQKRARKMARRKL